MHLAKQTKWIADWNKWIAYIFAVTNVFYSNKITNQAKKVWQTLWLFIIRTTRDQIQFEMNNNNQHEKTHKCIYIAYANKQTRTHSHAERVSKQPKTVCLSSNRAQKKEGNITQVYTLHNIIKIHVSSSLSLSPPFSLVPVRYTPEPYSVFVYNWFWRRSLCSHTTEQPKKRCAAAWRHRTHTCLKQNSVCR